MTAERLTDKQIESLIDNAIGTIRDGFAPGEYTRALLQLHEDLASAKAELERAKDELRIVRESGTSLINQVTRVRAVLHRVHEIGNAAGWAVLSDERGMISGLIEEALGMGSEEVA